MVFWLTKQYFYNADISKCVMDLRISLQTVLQVVILLPTAEASWVEDRARWGLQQRDLQPCRENCVA